ncbi:maleylpyruvate isomerase N-terminal domain-containing protein [Microlunatus phosphovorus]|uniref:maleylpyruvate isomerase N-terminal domain-containing protein n=1 Tax=Microlunatus phosphovorus TaxID=29405 RepID=UPI0002E3CFA8|nr:maleylpyruvate isomerase N-terminal domain-containing protein [Microlunatus phosphovorus]
MDNSVDEFDPLELLADLQREFAATIGDVDPAAPVPWCGEWRVVDLVEHLAGVHHWAAAQTRQPFRAVSCVASAAIVLGLERHAECSRRLGRV